MAKLSPEERLLNRKKSVNNYYSKHRLEINRKKKEFYRKNKENHLLLVRKNKLIKKFGITLEHFNLMLKNQNNKCAICKKEECRNLAVDHDHKTGKIRGLLCLNCNTGLGSFKDNLDLLLKAINYLKKEI